MTQTDIYGHQPRQMDDYGMDKRHYDGCDSCNNHVEPEKTEGNETTDLNDNEG